jgi:hypothetical protein
MTPGSLGELVGRDSFEDRGMPMLLAATRKHKLLVSGYYEKIAAEDTASRIKAAVGDINYFSAITAVTRALST